MTGFLLVSQNRQRAYSATRAELDYPVNIRSYRKTAGTGKAPGCGIAGA